MQVRSAAATTAVHGGLSERLFCTRKLNPQTTASSRANTATGVQATTDRPPPGTPSGTPRGRSSRDDRGVQQQRRRDDVTRLNDGQVVDDLADEHQHADSRAVTASGQCGAVSRASPMTTPTATSPTRPDQGGVEPSPGCSSATGMPARRWCRRRRAPSRRRSRAALPGHVVPQGPRRTCIPVGVRPLMPRSPTLTGAARPRAQHPARNLVFLDRSTSSRAARAGRTVWAGCWTA